MSVPVKESRPASPGIAGRRSTRLSIAIPISISGKDKDGSPFKENTRTAVINKQGAKIMTVSHLALGSELLIENRALKTTGRANIVWIGDRKSAKDPVEMGVQLLEATSLWGIEFPPEDWQEGPPVGVGGVRLEVAGAVSAPSRPASTQIPGKLEDASAARVPEPKLPPAVVMPAPTGIPATSSPEARGIRATTTTPPLGTSPPGAFAPEVALARFARQAQAVTDDQIKTFTAKLAKFTNQLGLQMQTQLQNSASEVEAKMVRSLDEQVGTLIDRLQASRAEVDTLVTRLQELQRTARSEAEKIQRNIQDAGWQALQSATEQLNESLQNDVQRLSQSVVDGARQRLDRESASILERMKQESSARQSETREQAKQQIEEARQQIAALANETLRALNVSVNDGLTEFQTQAEKELHEFQEKSSQVIEQHQGRMKAADAKLEETLTTVEGRTTKELESQLEKSAAKYRENLASELGKLAEETTKGAVGELHKRIDETVKEAADTVNENVASAAVFLGAIQEKAKGELEARFNQHQEINKSAIEAAEKERSEFTRSVADMVREVRPQPAQSAAVPREELLKELQSILDGQRRQMAEAAAQFESENERQLQARLQAAADKLLEEATALLTKQAEERVLLATERIQQQKEAAVNEAGEALRARLAEVFAPMLQPGSKKPRE